MRRCVRLISALLMLTACGGSSTHDKACGVVPRLSDVEQSPGDLAAYLRDTYTGLGAASAEDAPLLQALGGVAEAADNARAIREDVRSGESWSSTMAGGNVRQRFDAAAADLRRICGLNG